MSANRCADVVSHYRGKVGVAGHLTAVLRYTTIGVAMRAAAEEFEILRLVGVRANRVVAAAFAIFGLLAGAAALVWTAQRGSVDPLTGFFPRPALTVADCCLTLIPVELPND